MLHKCGYPLICGDCVPMGEALLYSNINIAKNASFYIRTVENDFLLQFSGTICQWYTNVAISAPLLKFMSKVMW